MRSVLSSGQITLCSPLFLVAAYMGKEDFCSSFQHSQGKKISRMLAEQCMSQITCHFRAQNYFAMCRLDALL